MVHTVFPMNAFSRLALIILAIMLGSLAHGQAPVKSSRGPLPKSGLGSGVILAEVDYSTGKLISARMLESTGSPRCDEKALAGLRHLRFKPHTRSPVKIPVRFPSPGSCSR